MTAGSQPEDSAKKTSWCWSIKVPQPERTGEVHRQIIVDGTYLRGWCVLIAHNGTHVIGWQWCDKESKAAWIALFKRFPAPDVVVTDGGTGLRAALDPRLAAGKEILALTRELIQVRNLDAAAVWMGDYAKNAAERPPWAKPNQAWWYTHIRLRRTQGLYRQLIRDHTHSGPGHLTTGRRAQQRDQTPATSSQRHA